MDKRRRRDERRRGPPRPARAGSHAEQHFRGHCERHFGASAAALLTPCPPLCAVTVSVTRRRNIDSAQMPSYLGAAFNLVR